MLPRRGAQLVILLALVCVARTAADQQPTPRPFPQPPRPAPGAAQPAKPATPPPTLPPTSSQPGNAPDQKTLGAPVYPTAQFITSYDAGRGQRFYLFGVTDPFAEIVGYYRAALKTRGEVLFETPPTHQFEIGRFREETMAFPPSVTVKDYTWGGSAGFPNPKRGGDPPRFPTIIQIVPAPAGTPPQ
jgi:hypothetical protein